MHHASRGFATSASSLAPSTVEVPQMGDSITEGSIAAVLKAPGDAVAVDEVVAQIETDKVTIDVRSPVAGTMTKVLVSEGDTVNVGQAVAEIEEGAAAQVAAASAASASAPAAETETPHSDTNFREFGLRRGEHAERREGQLQGRRGVEPGPRNHRPPKHAHARLLRPRLLPLGELSLAT